MKLFFDCEFTGLHKNTELISIGIVGEDGRAFYAEFDDYDKSIHENTWIKENVIDNLFLVKLDEKGMKVPKSYELTTILGIKYTIKQKLLSWLLPYKNQKIEFVSDVCHYDFVLLIDLLANNALELPKNICPACIDINQLIADKYWITLSKAFDKSREELLKELCIRNIKSPINQKHNSLYDAYVIKAIYEELININQYMTLI